MSTAQLAPPRQPEYPERPPVYAYEDEVANATLVIKNNGW